MKTSKFGDAQIVFVLKQVQEDAQAKLGHPVADLSPDKAMLQDVVCRPKASVVPPS